RAIDQSAACGPILPAGERLPQSYRALTPQNFAAGRCQSQHAVALRVDLNQPQHHELTQHGPPLRHIEVGADAEGAQAVVAELLDFRGALAAQDVDDMLGAEAESGGGLAARD